MRSRPASTAVEADPAQRLVLGVLERPEAAPGDRVLVGIALRPDRGRAAAEYRAFVEPSGRDRWQPGLARLDTRDVPKYVADAVVDG
jgi:hypothetical protein